MGATIQSTAKVNERCQRYLDLFDCLHIKVAHTIPLSGLGVLTFGSHFLLFAAMRYSSLYFEWINDYLSPRHCLCHASILHFLPWAARTSLL